MSSSRDGTDAGFVTAFALAGALALTAAFVTPPDPATTPMSA
ncbi:hypothetical protein ABGB18_42815 [Nonomuraea sp. B12E4]